MPKVSSALEIGTAPIVVIAKTVILYDYLQ